MFNTTIKLRGEYKFRAINADTGEVARETPWIPNLITNQGLDFIGQGNGTHQWTRRCSVGEGNTPPVNSDTALQTFHQYVDRADGTTTPGTSPDYTLKTTTRYLFPVQTVNKNYAEVGVGRDSGTGATTGQQLFSRALIVDSGGAPTTFTVLVGEQLEVTYRLWIIPPITDSTYDVVIAGVTYHCRHRAANLPNSGANYYGAYGFNWGNVATWDGSLYAGAIGPITFLPSGANIGMGNSTRSAAAYTAGSYTRSFTFSFSTTQGNVPGGGFRSIYYRVLNDINSGSGSPFPCEFQVDLGATLPKDNTKTMSLTFSITWARA